MSLTKPSAIIFDWDNTLVDTWPIIHGALNATLKAMDKPLWTFDMTKQRVRKSMRDSFPEVFGENWQEAANLYQSFYRGKHLDALTPLPGAQALLDAIHQEQVFCVVVSNKKGDNLRKEIQHLGWQHYFSNIVGADDSARDKPFRDPVDMAFIGAPVALDSSVWFVGDSDIDLECASNVGTSAVLYGPTPKEHGLFTATHFQTFPYHAYVADHDASIQLFRQLMSADSKRSSSANTAV